MTGRPLLLVRIQQARTLARELRGKGLKASTADRLAAKLEECAGLLGEGKPKGAASRKPTRRRRLWRRDPRCFWCGRMTDVETATRPDSATLEHVYARGHPRRRDTRRHLPSTLLACAECNHERGAPQATTGETCPLVESMT